MGEILRLLRIANDFTMSELARELDVSQPYISQIESGKKKPSEELIDKYARALGVKKSIILYFDSEQKIHNYKFQHLLTLMLNKICKL